MDEIRYGIIGCGMMGVEHLLNIEAIDGARVTALADPHPPSIDAALEAARHEPLVFADHRDLLASGACDAVVIATPNMTHVDILLDTFGTPHHVLVEKPLCTTVDDCRRVLDASTAHDHLVWVGLEYRYMPPVARLVDEVRNGAVGTVHMVAIREHRFPFLVKVDNWNRFSTNTGGTLVEKCCHFFDLMNLITDAQPVRVYASGGQDVNHLDEVYEGRRSDILDNAFVIVDYDSGARALLDLCMFADATRFQEELSVVGDLGKVEALLPQSLLRRGRRGEQWIGDVGEEHVHDDRVAHEGLHHGSSYLEHLDFATAVRTGTPPKVSLADGLLSVAMGVAAHRSIDTGAPVAMADIVG